jgi:PTH1 family peptidyl-tRNA hydrolase
MAGEEIILAKPQTYMNMSGEAVRDLAAFFKISMER